jgi:LmbE family N-acetylglucosaminyl deacetylase
MPEFLPSEMLSLNISKQEGLKVLCIGAHCDDIEIGCGGTVLHLLERMRNIEIYWVVLSSDPQREKEAKSSANLFLRRAGRKTVTIEKFRNGYFPYVGAEIKDYFEGLKGTFSPDLIFTHYRNDLHQDHRVVSELTWNTFRRHMILEYEIPKYDGDVGSPNFYVPLAASICGRKVRNVLRSFKTQADKHWLSSDLLYSMLRIRGMECVSTTRHAEAFYCRKISFA